MHPKAPLATKEKPKTTTTEQNNTAELIEKLHHARDEYDVAAREVRHTLQGPAKDHEAAKAVAKQKPSTMQHRLRFAVALLVSFLSR